MPRSLPPDHPVFGPCVSVRRKSFADWGMFCIFILPLGSLGGFLTFTSLAAIRAGFRRPPEFVACAIGILFLVVSLFLFRSMLRVVEFYHHGVVDRLWLRTREFAYADAERLTYALTRRTTRGWYSGTTLRFKLRLADGRRFSFRGIRKEGSSDILIPEARGAEELEIVRDAIVSHIAAKMLDRVRAEGSVEWSRAVRLSPHGLTPTRGRRRGTLIAWQDIVRTDYENYRFRIFDRDSDKPVLSLSCNASNFCPGFELFYLYKTKADDELGN